MVENERSVIKVKLNKLLYDHMNYSNLYKCINNSNEIIHNGYLFMRSFILYVIEKNRHKKCIEEPTINKEFIRIAFKVLNTTNNKGRPVNNDYIDILKDYKEIFINGTNCKQIDMTNLSYILGQSYDQIYISTYKNVEKRMSLLNSKDCNHNNF